MNAFYNDALGKLQKFPINFEKFKGNDYILKEYRDIMLFGWLFYDGELFVRRDYV